MQLFIYKIKILIKIIPSQIRVDFELTLLHGISSLSFNFLIMIKTSGGLDGNLQHHKPCVGIRKILFLCIYNPTKISLLR